jgi:hypothetical protein
MNVDGEPPSEKVLRKLARECRRRLATLRRMGAPAHRGQAAVAYYDAERAAGRGHSTALLDEASKAAGLKTRRRLEQLLKERRAALEQS